jgi:hypothetical protein
LSAGCKERGDTAWRISLIDGVLSYANELVPGKKQVKGHCNVPGNKCGLLPSNFLSIGDCIVDLVLSQKVVEDVLHPALVFPPKIVPKEGGETREEVQAREREDFKIEAAIKKEARDRERKSWRLFTFTVCNYNAAHAIGTKLASGQGIEFVLDGNEERKRVITPRLLFASPASKCLRALPKIGMDAWLQSQLPPWQEDTVFSLRAEPLDRVSTHVLLPAFQKDTIVSPEKQWKNTLQKAFKKKGCKMFEITAFGETYIGRMNRETDNVPAFISWNQYEVIGRILAYQTQIASVTGLAAAEPKKASHTRPHQSIVPELTVDIVTGARISNRRKSKDALEQTAKVPKQTALANFMNEEGGLQRAAKVEKEFAMPLPPPPHPLVIAKKKLTLKGKARKKIPAPPPPPNPQRKVTDMFAAILKRPAPTSDPSMPEPARKKMKTNHTHITNDLLTTALH